MNSSAVFKRSFFIPLAILCGNLTSLIFPDDFSTNCSKSSSAPPFHSASKILSTLFLMVTGTCGGKAIGYVFVKKNIKPSHQMNGLLFYRMKEVVHLYIKSLHHNILVFISFIFRCLPATKPTGQRKVSIVVVGGRRTTLSLRS